MKRLALNNLAFMNIFPLLYLTITYLIKEWTRSKSSTFSLLSEFVSVTIGKRLNLASDSYECIQPERLYEYPKTLTGACQGFLFPSGKISKGGHH